MFSLSAIKLNTKYAEQAHRNHESFRSSNRTKEPVRKTLKRRGKLCSEALKSRVACSNKTWKSLLMLYQPESPLGSVGVCLCGLNSTNLYPVFHSFRAWFKTGLEMVLGLSNNVGCLSCWLLCLLCGYWVMHDWNSWIECHTAMCNPARSEKEKWEVFIVLFT